jgi:electron transport complex protein RnfC
MKTFVIGGIKAPENKLTAGTPIAVMPLPKQAVIHLSQHAGEAATPIVAVGDKVKTGQLIGKNNGFISANIHSSVSGTVTKIEAVADAGGVKNMSVFIDVAPDEWDERVSSDSHIEVPRSFAEWARGCPCGAYYHKNFCSAFPDERKLCYDRFRSFVADEEASPEEVIEKIKDAGIVGMGGAAFPTHVKLSPPPNTKAEILIINAVECEPYLTSDHALMLEHGIEILEGVRILKYAAKVKKAVIGIENNKKDAIKHLTELAKRHFCGISIVPLKIRYPQGSEKQLVEAITGQQIPNGQLPIAVGAIVQNVGTAYAVYEAIANNKPLIERIVTVTGKHLTKPVNLSVRIGTPIHDLIAYAGGLPDDSCKVVAGGPMMGRALPSLDLPVTKGTSGILVLSAADTDRKTMRNCIRCARCTNVCCMGLNPSLLMNAVDFKDWDLVENNAILNCIECGSCSFVCPSNRPLLDYIRKGKTRIRAMMKVRAKRNNS